VTLRVTVPLNMVSKLTLGNSESITQGDVNILMDMSVLGVTLHHDLVTGQRDINADMERLTLVMSIADVPVMLLDNYSTAGDMVAKLFQLANLLADALLDRVGMIDAVEADLQGNPHGISSTN
jgi:hypothetical protein